MRNTLLFSLCLGASFGTAAIAQQWGHGIDLKQGAGELGIMVGSAYACTPDENKKAARREAETMFDMILSETGHETAYLFAVSVGYSAGSGTTDVQCDAVMDYVAGIKSKMFTGGSQ